MKWLNGMSQAESKPFPLGRFPYKIAISREELAIGLAHRNETGEPIQTFIRRLIREHGRARGSERFSAEQLSLRLHRRQAPSDTPSADAPDCH
jgi:hypothetical protein